MSIHRTIIVHDACVVCGVTSSERDVQIYVGVPDFAVIHVGDRLQWTGSPYMERGGRPATTTGIAYGIGACRSCGASIDYDVAVRDSLVTAVDAVGPSRPQLPLRSWRDDERER